MNKISIFDQNFYFWPKFWCLTIISILTIISTFEQNFDFWPKFRFLIKILFVDPQNLTVKSDPQIIRKFMKMFKKDNNAEIYWPRNDFVNITKYFNDYFFTIVFLIINNPKSKPYLDSHNSAWLLNLVTGHEIFLKSSKYSWPLNSDQHISGFISSFFRDFCTKFGYIIFTRRTSYHFKASEFIKLCAFEFLQLSMKFSFKSTLEIRNY